MMLTANKISIEKIDSYLKGILPKEICTVIHKYYFIVRQCDKCSRYIHNGISRCHNCSRYYCRTCHYVSYAAFL